QEMVDRTFMEFAEVVADGRNFPSAEHVRDATFGDGRVLSGEQARTYNLVDQLGYFSDAVSHAKDLANVQRAKVVRFQPRVSMFDRMLSMSANSALLPESVLPAEIRALKPGRLYYLAPHSVPRSTER
ncbi:MAG: S49 family peptidase, partial [bacterium]